MRRSMNVILIVVVTCSLILTVQHSILAQARSKQETQRKMQKAKEIKPGKGDQTERKVRAKDDVKSEGTQISGMERYRAIIQNNLFMPLGSGGEVKQEEFVLIGTIGKSAFIQMQGSDKSFYVAEGQSFGNNAKLVRVGENSVIITHEGNKKELELASGALASQGKDAKGGGSKQRQGSKEMKTANRAGKEGWNGAEKGRGSGGEKKGGDTSWARNMSMEELGKARGDIARYIEGLRAKGVTDPEQYEGAIKKMEIVDRAITEKQDSE